MLNTIPKGTTPTITFTCSKIDCGNITLLNICFVQEEKIVLEKCLQDCVIEGNTIKLTLSEEDTLLFDCDKGLITMQLRAGVGDKRFKSDPILATTDQLFKEGCL